MLQIAKSFYVLRIVIRRTLCKNIKANIYCSIHSLIIVANVLQMRQSHVTLSRKGLYRVGGLSTLYSDVNKMNREQAT